MGRHYVQGVLMISKNVFYKKGFKYQLSRPCVLASSVRPPESVITDFYEILTNGTLIGQTGYAYDGPSGPTIDSKSAMRPALGHDIVYQAMREGLLPWSYKKTIDDDFYRWLIEDGMWMWRARIWHKAVTKRGGKEPDNPYKEYSAPNSEAVHFDSTGSA